MIEFKKNGPFEFPEEENRCVKIIGIGAAGVGILDQIVLDHCGTSRAGEDWLALDTDQQVIFGTVAGEKLLVGASTLKGMGTGGDPELARELAGEEIKQLRSQLDGTEIAILITGLGGGTGSGLTLEVLDVLKEMNCAALVLGVTPLHCEGARRLKQAQQAAVEIKRRADGVFLFSNERLARLQEPDEDVRQSFQMMNRLMGMFGKGLADLLSRKGLVQLGFDEIGALTGCCEALNGELENCWVGSGLADGEDRVVETVAQVLSSPLFEDRTAWETSDRALVLLEGGEDFSVSEFQEVMSILREEVPSDVELTAGATVNPDLTGALSLTMVAVRSGEEKVVTEELLGTEISDLEEEETVLNTPSEPAEPALTWEDSQKTKRKGRGKAQRYFAAEQPELPLETPVLRGRFEKSTPTVLNGQNLDQPTFLRLGLKVRL